jgi:hypothetical protein
VVMGCDFVNTVVGTEVDVAGVVVGYDGVGTVVGTKVNDFGVHKRGSRRRVRVLRPLRHHPVNKSVHLGVVVDSEIVGNASSEQRWTYSAWSWVRHFVPVVGTELDVVGVLVGRKIVGTVVGKKVIGEVVVCDVAGTVVGT